MNNTQSFLMDLGERALPRILTQISRDPASPFFGSCDRNWWHYKIRDFSSIILQQAGYAIYVAAETPIGAGYALNLKDLAAATCRFWNDRAQLHGAFEEYYPYEQGYPPLAFSTLTVAKLCFNQIVPLIDVRAGLELASKQLLCRFEAEAANQQVAGVAALSVIRSFCPELVPETAFQDLLTRTLNLQTEEGWFPEYDGPDLGYLSVTIDCLWDIFDATVDKRCRSAIDAAFDYLSWFVLGPVGTAGMHNARNTDYIVPYGIARLACNGSSRSTKSMSVMKRLFNRQTKISHFFDAIDDRYWCHYIGHSIFRAISVLSKLKQDTCSTESVDISVLPKAMPQAGHFLLKIDKIDSPTVLISAKKGGIFTALWPGEKRLSDFGWIVNVGSKVYVSHWWSLDWDVSASNDEVTCTGLMVAHKEHVSNPWKHMVLRVASLVAGRRIIGFLKKLIIFKPNNSAITFSRRVRCESNSFIVYDKISSLRAIDKLARAPRSSKRHVASADSFHPEDFILLKGVKMSEKINDSANELIIITRYEAIK